MIDKATEADKYIHLSQLSHTLSQQIQNTKHALCIVVDNNAQITQACEELAVFLPEHEQARILPLPDWETLPYDAISAHRQISTRRIRTLYQITQTRNPVLIISIHALIQKIIPKKFVLEQCFLCRVGDTLSIDDFRSLMLAKGYDEVPDVSDTGQFAIRGAILDVVLSEHAALGFRIELFDNEIDSIRRLDVRTNRSDESLQAIEILPSREFTTSETKSTVIEKTKHYCPEHLHQELKRLLRHPKQIHGIEYYLPFLYETMDTIVDYLPDNTHFYVPNHLESRTQTLMATIQDGFTKQINQNRPAAYPSSLYIEGSTLPSSYPVNRYCVIKHKEDTNESMLPSLITDPKRQEPYQALSSLIKNIDKSTLYAQNQARCENLQRSLESHNIPCIVTTAESKQPKNTLKIQIGALREGFIHPESGQAFISENDLIGRVINDQRQSAKPKIADTLENWQIGTLIVHRDFGIGRFLEFKTIVRDNIAADFLILEYADNDKLYVATHQFHLLSRYIGPKVKTIVMSKLGGKKWQMKKKKAMENADLFAKKLLDQHAMRQTQQAQSLSCKDADMAQFCEYFPYTETEDQLHAIESILADIKHPNAMNRLLCGDVGFGKTEVAMRAAFATVYSGAQVAVPAPTTVLAQQHLNTFSERFGHFPVRVATLSRLMTKTQQEEIKVSLRSGAIDILIATHSLLRNDINFANLGLLIIDEEHKFGVKQKELIHAIGAKAHVLAMSATPIPRSLHMSLAKLRDMTIIATPPKNRQAITTFVHVYDESIVKEAISREIQRGGQCYIIHNDIRSLEIIKENIQRLLPHVQCRTMHAKQPKAILEQTMVDFQKGTFDVLLATTIVESGIDIANANTMIMLRADLLGLSQIHQLRGRVGRSHHQAYAYLMTPPKEQMTADGRARIATISKQKQLGAGLNIAIEDLEIRGAGDLLGKKQSGNADEVGLTLYSDMLKNASQRLSGETIDIDSTQIDIDLGLDIHIPKNYIADIAKRLHYYRSVNNCQNEEAINALQDSMEDQFGVLPKSVANLLVHRQIQQRAQQLNITRIIHKETYFVITMASHQALRNLMQNTKINKMDIRIVGEKIHLMKYKDKPLHWLNVLDKAGQKAT